MVPSLPMLSYEFPVSVKQNPDGKKKTNTKNKKQKQISASDAS